MFLNIGKRCHLARCFVEWLHGKGDAEDEWKFTLDDAGTRDVDGVYFIEGFFGKEGCTEVPFREDPEVTF